jgi:small subunit ribosomal protein S3
VGQKTHPIGFRLGIIKKWNSTWFEQKNYVEFLHEDLKIRKHIKEKLFHASIAKTEIERTANKVTVIIYTGRPGIIIGKKGAEVEELKKDLQRRIGREVFIKIQEIRRADLDAQLVAENVAGQLMRRVAFRRAMKKAVQNTMKMGAQGIRIACAGRLGGAEMARREWYREGRVPLHTLRADIDYGYHQAITTYGAIGIKVWIYHGEVSTS